MTGNCENTLERNVMENKRMDKIDKKKQKNVNNPIISFTGMESFQVLSLFFLTKSILLTRH